MGFIASHILFSKGPLKETTLKTASWGLFEEVQLIPSSKLRQAPFQTAKEAQAHSTMRLKCQTKWKSAKYNAFFFLYEFKWKQVITREKMEREKTTRRNNPIENKRKEFTHENFKNMAIEEELNAYSCSQIIAGSVDTTNSDINVSLSSEGKSIQLNTPLF